MAVEELLLGFTLAITSTVVLNVAPIMQKAGVDQLHVSRGGTFTGKQPTFVDYFKNKTWVIGFLLGTLGGIPYFFSIQYIGISISQPLTAFGFIILAFVASKKLGEKMTRTMLAGVLILTVMPLFLSFSSVSNAQADMGDPAVVSSFILTCIVLECISFALAASGRFVKKKGYATIAWALCSACGFAVGAMLAQGMFSFLASGGYDLFQDLPRLFPLLFAGDVYVIGLAISGICCGVANFVAFACVQVGYKKGNATTVYPVCQSVNILISITGGIFIFGQAIGVPVLYMIAIACTVAGTAILGRYQATIPLNKE